MKGKPTKRVPAKTSGRKAPVVADDGEMVIKKTDLTKPKLVGFRKLLLDRRQELCGSVKHLEDEALKSSRQDASGDLSTMPIHMADLASDNFEQEFTLGLLETEQDELRSIDDALGRIDEGTYGVCEACNTQVPEERLKIVPFARLCIKCKTKEEAEADKA